MKKLTVLIWLFMVILCAVSMNSCGGEDDEVVEVIEPATFKSASPPEGTEIAVDETLLLDFDNPPEGVQVSAGRALIVDNMLKISGDFDPGSLTLEVTWENGPGETPAKQVLAYPVVAPDIAREVLIPAGEFQMGADDEDADSDELPVHTVYVDAFYMDAHEVTNIEYQQFLLENPSWQKANIEEKFHDGAYLKVGGKEIPVGRYL